MTGSSWTTISDPTSPSSYSNMYVGNDELGLKCVRDAIYHLEGYGVTMLKEFDEEDIGVPTFDELLKQSEEEEAFETSDGFDFRTLSKKSLYLLSDLLTSSVVKKSCNIAPLVHDI